MKRKRRRKKRRGRRRGGGTARVGVRVADAAVFAGIGRVLANETVYALILSSIYRKYQKKEEKY